MSLSAKVASEKQLQVESERERVQVGAEGTSIVGQLEKRRETPPQTLFPQAERERNAA